MGELASKDQLRMSFLRWALVTVPTILFCGFFVGRLAGSNIDNRWLQALDKPGWFPPGWVFPLVWGPLYIMLGLVLAMLLHARGARNRRLALGLFLTQLVLNFCWSPLFFGAHQVSLALVLILTILVLAIATTFAIAPIRKVAAWMMVPYMVWLCLASLLNFQLDQRNPDAEMMVPPTPAAEIQL